MSRAACKFRANSCHERYEVLTALRYSDLYNETEIPVSGQKTPHIFSQAPTKNVTLSLALHCGLTFEKMTCRT